MNSNDQAGVAFRQPRTLLERTDVATKCCSALRMTMPLLVDSMDDRVGHAYSGMPDRLYVIGTDGKVAYPGGRGPFGFKTGEMEQILILLLLDEADRAKEARVPLLSDEQAWKKLLAAEQGAGQPLPPWARALAAALPHTTAAMLELDHVQRTSTALDPILRGKMRWVAARANGCSWTEAQARADLVRAGLSESGLKALAGDWKGLPEKERAALSFARKLTTAAYAVADEEMAGLIRDHGDKQVVAMVLLLAYSNFQDRLVLALGLSPDSHPPLAPLAVRFRAAQVERAPRKMPEPPADPVPERVVDEPWRAMNFGRLQELLEGQKARAPRIAVPSWDEVKQHLPSAARPVRIKWSLVCMGYQPQLAGAWGKCLRTFGQEARQDRVFEELVFWVVTRELHCFY